jgi:spermidine synthase
LRAALDVLPANAEVVVAEVFACVIEWNRTYLKDLQQGALEDRRTRIVEADVWWVIFDRGPWDAILLDVDNGPVAWCLDSNYRLYDKPGLLQIQSALTPQGVLAVWSANPDPRFVKMLRKSGFDARSHAVRARGLKGARHTVFVARRRD